MGEGIFYTSHHSRFTGIIKLTPLLYFGVVVGNDSDLQNKLISMYHIVQL